MMWSYFPQTGYEQQLHSIIPHFPKGRKASELILKKISLQVGLPEKFLSFVITDLIRDSDSRLGIEQYLEQHLWIPGLRCVSRGTTTEKNRKQFHTPVKITHRMMNSTTGYMTFVRFQGRPLHMTS